VRGEERTETGLKRSMSKKREKRAQMKKDICLDRVSVEGQERAQPTHTKSLETKKREISETIDTERRATVSWVGARTPNHPRWAKLMEARWAKWKGNDFSH